MATANSTAPVFTPADREWFWARVYTGEPDECWPWLRAKNEHGYGIVRVASRRRNYRAHAIARFLTSGEWPDGLHTLHRCDNPSCCNPAHLWLGTPADNAADRESKGRGRQPPGERCALAKLNAADVQEIRRTHVKGYGNTTKLAKRFGVTRGTIKAILRRKTWKHI